MTSLRRISVAGLGACALFLNTVAWSLGQPAPGLVPYQPHDDAGTRLSSMGDAAMGPLMDAWLEDYRSRQPQVEAGLWVHLGDTHTPHGLTNAVSDIAPIVGAPQEMTYRVRFQRNGVTRPLLIRVGTRQLTQGDEALYLAANPGAGRPPARKVAAFLDYVTSREGQAVVAASADFHPLTEEQARHEREKLAQLYYLAPTMARYVPAQSVAGALQSVGSAQMAEWMDRAFVEFRRYHPGVYKGENWRHPGSSAAISAILTEQADIAPLGREIGADEQADYLARFGRPGPRVIRMAHGARLSEIRSNAIAIYVNAGNPVEHLTIAQLRGIFGAAAQAESLTEWGQLGLPGSWRKQAIRPYFYTESGAPFSFLSHNIGSRDWSKNVRSLEQKALMRQVASDPGMIALGSFDDPTPGIRAVPVAFDEHTPASAGSPEDVALQRYPLTRNVYMLLDTRRPSPQAREFMRFLLSREGQEIAVQEGYFALSADEAARQLQQLE